MYSVEVAPVERRGLKGTLTFFSREPVPVGAVVSAPVRKRMVPALVLSVTDVRELKLDLKASGFALKKLGTAAPRRLCTAAFMRGMTESARYHAADIGATLAHLTFSSLLSDAKKIEPAPAGEDGPARTVPEVLALQAGPTERIQAYRNMVRECFARGKSVLLIAPSLAEVERLQRELSRGIEDRVVVATSLLAARPLRAAWDRTATLTEPMLLIGTPPVLSFPRTDIDTIIVERESARAYVSRARPHIDFRRTAECVARASGARLLLADFPLRVETYARVMDGTLDELARPQVRSSSTARISVIDARKSDEHKGERRRFAALQPSTIEALHGTLSAGGRAVVFAARKGIAPLTVCNDCGTPVADPATGAPMVLHKTPAGNVFMSHRSGAVLPAERSCATCGGWNLVTLGIGVDRVHDELKKHFPRTRHLLFTQDTAATHRTAKKLIDTFYSTPGAVLVGTERMLPYLAESVPLSVVASIDSVLSLPAWRAHEHALSILFALFAHTDRELVVETRKADSPVMRALSSGTPMDFLRDETKERHAYGYPPFSTFVGLSWSGTEAACAERAARIKAALVEYDLVGPLPPETIERGRYTQRAVVRVMPSDWPDDALLALLRTLPTDIEVSVDPDDIV